MENHKQQIQQVIDQIRNTPDVDCNQVDVHELENMGANIANSVTEYMLNIDITKASFDVDLMHEEA